MLRDRVVSTGDEVVRLSLNKEVALLVSVEAGIASVRIPEKTRAERIRRACGNIFYRLLDQQNRES